MKLLLTNDDGINAEGIYALAAELGKYHEIIVAAPDSQRSACGHSITLGRPVVVKDALLKGLKCKAYSVDGTPADCVRIALDKLVDGKVDMVVSGINRGLNLGTDVIYSGTVSAAVEAAMYKVPSVAVSLDTEKANENYETAAQFARDIIDIVKKQGIAPDVVINLNVPNIPKDNIKGIKVCKIGSRSYTNNFVAIKYNEGEVTYDLRDELVDETHEDTDTQYLKEGYVTITPLHYDLTNFILLNEVKKWF